MQKFDRSYLRMAEIWAENSYCKRRKVGALIVKDNMIISDGYNGTPSGFENICEDENGVTKPYVLHAEANAIISAKREQMIGASLYLVGKTYDTKEIVSDAICCSMCKRMVINAGIKEVIVRVTNDEYKVYKVEDWIQFDESIEGVFGY